MEAIDIILITHNKLGNTIQCLDALYQNTPIPFKLTIIDDSTDLTPEYIGKLALEKGNINFVRPEVKLLSGNQTINIALKLTQSDPVIFLCNSTFVEPDWLFFALKLMGENSDVGLVGFKILYPETNLIIEAGEMMNWVTGDRYNIGMGELGHRHSYIREVDAVGWSAILIRRNAIPEGGFDENFYIGWRGNDDTDNCLEMKKRGWKIMYNGLGTVYHQLSSCMGDGTEQGRMESAENYRRFKEKWRGYGLGTVTSNNQGK